MTRDDLRCRLAYPNVRAFLAVIRTALGTWGPAGYKTRADGSIFHGWKHPIRAVDMWSGGHMSSRAGAYRIPHRTWEGLALRFGFKDFGADAQDEAAVALLDMSGALGNIMTGHFLGALAHARDDWPELPMKDHAGGTIPLARAIEIYEQHGGQFVPTKQSPPPLPHGRRLARDMAAFWLGVALGGGLVLAASWDWWRSAP